MNKFLIMIGLSAISYWGFSQQTGSFTDERDKQVYQTVVIGTQTWMSQNLNFNAGKGSWCYDMKEENCKKVGRLYKFDIAPTVCTAGWHLPSKEEFDVLRDFIEKNTLDLTAKSGFNSLLGGWFAGGTETFADINTYAYYWTSTSVNDYYGEAVYNTNNYYPEKYQYFKNCGYSVRCIKNK
jgi:uncharacterized protein (TIGR02145 family)